MANLTEALLADYERRPGRRERKQMPTKIMKSIFTSVAPSRAVFGGNSVGCLSHVSDLFFEQVCQDLKAYADHAGRSEVQSKDVQLLMERQRLINNEANLEALAHEHLPRELWDELCVSAVADNYLHPLYRE
ncbi:hypothetical protein BC940DRAFT_308232 [Gongronella butleri]|nr:hypothetical protein BC940DRAFT_308232 [Gongronella butleri]